MLCLILLACARAPTLTGRYTKVMEDSGETATLVISSDAAGKPQLRLQDTVIPVTVEGDALVHPFTCEAGADGRRVEGKARLVGTATGVDYVLVSPPDVGPSWDCNGDFDVVFGGYRREAR